MTDKIKVIVNAINTHYRSEITICDKAQRAYNPHHFDYLYISEIQKTLDDLTEQGLIKKIEIPILNENYYKINPEVMNR